MQSDYRQGRPFGAVGLGRASHPQRFDTTPADRRAGFVRRALNLLILWQGRVSQRCRLANLEDCYLADMGMSRAAAEAEAAKPFWRD